MTVRIGEANMLWGAFDAALFPWGCWWFVCSLVKSTDAVIGTLAMLERTFSAVRKVDRPTGLIDLPIARNEFIVNNNVKWLMITASQHFVDPHRSKQNNLTLTCICTLQFSKESDTYYECLLANSKDRHRYRQPDEPTVNNRKQTASTRYWTLLKL